MKLNGSDAKEYIKNSLEDSGQRDKANCFLRLLHSAVQKYPEKGATWSLDPCKDKGLPAAFSAIISELEGEISKEMQVVV